MSGSLSIWSFLIQLIIALFRASWREGYICNNAVYTWRWFYLPDDGDIVTWEAEGKNKYVVQLHLLCQSMVDK